MKIFLLKLVLFNVMVALVTSNSDKSVVYWLVVPLLSIATIFLDEVLAWCAQTIRNLRALRRVSPSSKMLAPAPARRRVEMVRGLDGRFVAKAPPKAGDPYTQAEIDAAMAEIDAELTEMPSRVDGQSRSKSLTR